MAFRIRKMFGICLLGAAWGLGLFLPPATARDQPPETQIMGKSERDEDDEGDDDEVLRRETFPNVNPLLSPEIAPGFTMKESEVVRLHYRKRKRPAESISEHWAKGPPAGFTRSTLIKIQLFPLKNQAKALKAAEVVFLATTDRHQILNGIGKPNPGSFSGQPIGDYCWAFKLKGLPRSQFNSTATLVVIENSNLFRIQVTGSGETGAGIEDSYAENLAKALVRRLKTWQRPQ